MGQCWSPKEVGMLLLEGKNKGQAKKKKKKGMFQRLKNNGLRYLDTNSGYMDANI